MSLTLRAVLELEAFQRALPEIIYGEHLLDRHVRWVHTSELVEAAALLEGGELLLTTGLGLAGRGPVAQRGYVEQLAERDAAALVLELGWTFASVPNELAAAARRCELPLIAMREIVPFVKLTEEVQTRIVHRDIAELRARRRVDEVIDHQLATGGLWGLLEATAQVTGCPAVLESAAGHPIAWGGLETAEPGDVLVGVDLHSVEMNVLGSHWGWLHLVGPPSATPELVDAMLARVRQLASLALADGGQRLTVATQLRHDFLVDVVRGRALEGETLTARATMIGLRVPVDTHLVGFALGPAEPNDERILRYAGQAVASGNGGLASEIDGTVIGVIVTNRSEAAPQTAERLLHEIDAALEQQCATSRPRLSVGNATSHIREIHLTLRDAREALTLAEQLGLRQRAVSAAGIDADRALATIIDEPDVLTLIEERLGPLIGHDHRHGSELVNTLRLYLLNGSSKTATAHALQIQRQTVHQRLQRIQQLIGPVDHPDSHLARLLALAAHDLRQRRDPDDASASKI